MKIDALIKMVIVIDKKHLLAARLIPDSLGGAIYGK